MVPANRRRDLTGENILSSTKDNRFYITVQLNRFLDLHMPAGHPYSNNFAVQADDLGCTSDNTRLAWLPALFDLVRERLDTKGAKA